MKLDTPALIRRIDQLLAIPVQAGDQEGIYASVVEAMQGCVTLAEALYGNAVESRQVHTVLKAAQLAREQKQNVAISFRQTVRPVVKGTLRALKADLEAGLVGSIELRAAGEVIADPLGSRRRLSQQVS
jgi:hypothetical protein